MASGSGEKHDDEFKHFDVVSDVSDHHYRQSNHSGKEKRFSNLNSSVYKKIMKEWRSLEENLPECIYVRVYETRIDLLRAVIIGAEGTPYHNGLFFFDIVLPSDYPSKPPKVSYCAHGLRLNPNLYAGGKVCLSLLNTWYGAETEKWTASSTILQLLVSIQGLVLNDQPYFNEPGYEAVKSSNSAKWVQKSATYNADVFLLSSKTMLYTISNPPKNFEVFVAQHFRARADSILAAMQNYPLMVGSSSVQVSSSFNSKLKTMHSFLSAALENKENASDSEPSNRGCKEKGSDVKKPKKGLMDKLINVVKGIWK